jgi:hypothetical protein
MVIQELCLVPRPGRNWRVALDFTVLTTGLQTITVPAGFLCDLNSMPRCLWWASTPTDYPEAGVVHDYLYDQQVPRAAADAVYLELLRALGMGSIRANARYYALRLFGGIAYWKHSKHKPWVSPLTPHTDKLPPVTGIPPILK